MVEIKEEFRVRLEKALNYNSMRPADLARLSGLSEATISQYRSGYARPKDKRLILLANILHVDPSWLMGLDVPMFPGVTQLEELAAETVRDKRLLDYFHQLNEAGKDQALLQLFNLTQIPTYVKGESSGQTSTA